jgi:hypothetical protein
MLMESKLRHVECKIITDVSEFRTTSILRVYQSKTDPEDEAAGSHKTPVTIYQSIWRNIAEGSKFTVIIPSLIKYV